MGTQLGGSSWSKVSRSNRNFEMLVFFGWDPPCIISSSHFKNDFERLAQISSSVRDFCSLQEQSSYYFNFLFPSLNRP